MSKKQIRTRFAPSPTGNPHLGSIWTALFNWLHTRHFDGKFILRIEDTDQTRLVPGAEEKIIEALHWYGLDYDEGPDVGGDYGPYRQSERLTLYRQYVAELISHHSAYYCFCSTERLQELRQTQERQRKPTRYDGHCRALDPKETERRRKAGETAVVRLKIPHTGETSFDDIIRGRVTFQNALLDDQVLLKSDGWPTYHLASVVDDHLMNINPVIRAEEWLPSTPKQLLIYQALDWSPPEFAHLPLILGPDRSKLSKRHGSVDALLFREEGYLPDAIINFLALLGWNPKTSEEFFSRAKLIKRFDLKTINKAGAIFDNQKLAWFNAHYLRTMPLKKVTALAAPYLKQAGAKKLSTATLQSITKIAIERAKKLSDIPALTAFFFNQPQYDSALLNWKTTNPTITQQRLQHLVKLLTMLTESDFEETNLEKTIKAIIDREKLGVGETLWPMRVALTGLTESPSPFAVASILKKTETLSRLSNAIKKLSDV